MGLFTPNYNKPGPGVDKNAPEKHRIWQFFEIFWNQLSKLCSINLLYFIAMLPLVAGLWLCFKIDANAPLFIALRTPNTIDLVGLLLLVISVFISFPATMGFTYVLRNIQRREHAWIWHDFIKHTKSNYKKGVINGALTLAVYYLCINAYAMYSSQQVFSSPYISALLSLVILFLMIVFTWMQFYVNTITVTFDLKLSQIYKNCFIFAIAKIPLNIFISIICIAITVGILLIPIAIVPLILWVLILYSLFGFITVFSVYPTIDKYMISQVESQEEETHYFGYDESEVSSDEEQE